MTKSFDNLISVLCEEMTYTSKGRVFISNDGSVKIICDKGLLEYYKKMVEKRFWIKTHYPKHGPHISIVLPKHHKNVDLNKIKKYNGKIVSFKYDPYVYIGGQGKGYRNFWLKVECPFANKIKEELGIRDNKNFLGLHLTISNTKNS